MSSMSIQPSQEFIDLCETLYGPVVDPYAVLEDFAKRAADPDKPSGFKRALEGVALASTVAGGVLGVKEGHGAIKEIRAAGGLRKAPNSALRSLGIAGLATGGDAITTGVLAAQNKKSAAQNKQLVPTGVAKRQRYLVPTSGVDKAFPGMTPLRSVVRGLREAWNPSIIETPKSRLTEAISHADRAVKPKVVPDAAPKGEPVTTRAQAKAAKVANDKALQAQTHRQQGADVATMLNTNSGKAATAVAGGAAVYGGSKLMPRRSRSMEYVPDTYAKADGNDVVFKGHFVDFDDDKKQAFGWASVVKINGAPVIDRQGDYISIEDLEKAAYTYVHKSRVGGDMHKRNGDAPHKVSDMIESIVYTDDKCKAMGLPESFPRGWWVGYQIHDPETWSLVRKQGRTGFSIHGRGIRKDVDVDELMGV